MAELKKYQELAVILECDEVSKIVLTHMEGLLRRLLQLIITKEEAWTVSGFMNESEENEWQKPDQLQWTNLSPHDWITILFSISLASKNIGFCQSFGKELRSIEESLLHFRTNFSPKVLLVDGNIVYESHSPYTRKYIKACQEMNADTDKRDAIVKLEMPEKLSDSRHWGHIAWKYVHFLSKSSDAEDSEGGVTMTIHTDCLRLLQETL